MNILKFIALGAAVAYGVSYLTKRDANGRSVVDDVLDKAPDLVNKLKEYGRDALEKAKAKAV